MKRIVLFFLVLLCPAGLSAREQMPERGMLLERGQWRTPTPTSALRTLQVEESDADGRLRGRNAAEAVLRQHFESRSKAELDAFADDLVRLIRDGTKLQAYAAHMALIHSAAVAEEPGRGVPYTGAADAFIRLYESYDGEARLQYEGDQALYGIFETGGVDYVRALFDASEQPPPCQWPPMGLDVPQVVENPCPNVCAWCQAGKLLLAASGGPAPELWSRLCEYKRH
ncbi:MAG: S46 family peptidase [Gemmatimonadales bacterium]|nr:S46 family peptidase [Gemmatimonadales bacterium]